MHRTSNIEKTAQRTVQAEIQQKVKLLGLLSIAKEAHESPR